MTSDSLLASAKVLPAASVASVAASPAEPVIALSTTSHGQPGQLRGGVRARHDPRQPGAAVRPPAALGLRVQGELEILNGGRPGDPDDRRPGVQHLLSQQLDLPTAGRQPDDPELLRPRPR